jgi:hypothetical protein
MDKKEALKQIIYILKEIDDTRQRLANERNNYTDIEVALLNQQVVNLYQRIIEYQKIAAALPAVSADKPEESWAPRTASPKEEAAASSWQPMKKEEPAPSVRETESVATAPVQAEPTPEPIQTTIAESPAAEFRKSETPESPDKRKERLQRLQEEERETSSSSFSAKPEAVSNSSSEKQVETPGPVTESVVSDGQDSPTIQPSAEAVAEIHTPRPEFISSSAQKQESIVREQQETRQPETFTAPSSSFEEPQNQQTESSINAATPAANTAPRVSELSKRFEENREKNAKAEKELSLNEKHSNSSSSLNDKFQGQVKKNLADKLKLSPISDLKTAISLNQRIAFINKLFNGDDKEYKKVLNFITDSRNFSEAKYYLQSEVGPVHNWNEQDELVQEFMELVYRKFL